jgi:hypothetical protein
VDDTGISRKHVEILWDARAEVNDLQPPTGRNSTACRPQAPLAPDCPSMRESQ